MSAQISILDVACGSRMFWFDRQHPNALFLDKRAERHSLKDKSSRGGYRDLVIAPDQVADFTDLPFPAERFALVVFDPPHLVGNGTKSWLAKKYGKLGADWRDDIREGFAECFRVLRPEGVLVFKWNENDIRLSEALALTPETPLFGNRGGKNTKSHWLVFMKLPASADTHAKRGDSTQIEAPSPMSGAVASAQADDRRPNPVGSEQAK